jgi:hypothetical protein
VPNVLTGVMPSYIRKELIFRELELCVINLMAYILLDAITCSFQTCMS